MLERTSSGTHSCTSLKRSIAQTRRVNSSCWSLMLMGHNRYGAFERVPRHKQYGDGQDYCHISDCSSNRLLPHFVTDISDAVLE